MEAHNIKLIANELFYEMYSFKNLSTSKKEINKVLVEFKLDEKLSGCVFADKEVFLLILNFNFTKSSLDEVVRTEMLSSVIDCLSKIKTKDGLENQNIETYEQMVQRVVSNEPHSNVNFDMRKHPVESATFRK